MMVSNTFRWLDDLIENGWRDIMSCRGTLNIKSLIYALLLTWINFDPSMDK